MAAQSPSMTNDGSITFLPGMMDPMCGTSPVEHRTSAMKLMTQDMRLMSKNMMRCIPTMLRSLMNGEMVPSNVGEVRDAMLQIGLACVEMCVVGMVCMMPMMMMLPAIVSVMILALCVLMIITLSMPMNGEQVMRSHTPAGSSVDDFNDEHWIYVNGMMTSCSSMQLHLNRLSRIFMRQMTGIHNHTYGPIIDIILNSTHSMLCTSTCCMNLHAEMRDALMSPKCHKVIVVAQGTGATNLTHALDRLHSDMPMELMAKMEIYTFGAAAKHMSNPCMTMDRNMMSLNGDRTMRADGLMKDGKIIGEGMAIRVEEAERVIPHMEHYMMSFDLLARCGIMYHSMTLLDNRFCGRVFMVNRPGFMLTHYLDMMFPPVHTGNESVMPMDGAGILNQCPVVDIETCEKREFMANAMAAVKMMGNKMGGMMKGVGMEGMMKDMKVNSMTGGKLMNGKWVMDGMRSDGMKEMMMDNSKGLIDSRRNSGTGADGSVAMARMNAKECEGKTVRQLSRLWRYAGGCKPSSEGMGMMNGIGLGLSGMDMQMPNGMMVNGMNGSMDMGNMDTKNIKGIDMKDMKMNGKNMKKGIKSNGSIDMRNGGVLMGSKG